MFGQDQETFFFYNTFDDKFKRKETTFRSHRDFNFKSLIYLDCLIYETPRISVRNPNLNTQSDSDSPIILIVPSLIRWLTLFLTLNLNLNDRYDKEFKIKSRWFPKLVSFPYFCYQRASTRLKIYQT